MATENFTGGPFQKEGAPPVTAVVIGTPDAKPVVNCGTIQRARRQSAGYAYSYAHGGYGCPFCHVVVPWLGFSGVPGAAAISARVFMFLAQVHEAMRRSSRRRVSITTSAWKDSLEISDRDAI